MSKDVNQNTTSIWSESGSNYIPADNASHTKKIPPGIYKFRPTMTGWYLERTANVFTFPYKLYGAVGNNVIERVSKAWNGLEGNLGIFMNGLKGTGKTVNAQLIANWGNSIGLPCLVVSEPIDVLQDVLQRLEQDMIVLFDEFEKTHSLEQQQHLLTTIDGMARNKFKRLFLFTTNNPNVDENFIDRPSRIRYTWTYSNLQDDVIDEMIADMLNPKLNHFIPAIKDYINTRVVKSVDTIKAILGEVNLFEESPESFDGILNLTKRAPKSFNVYQLDSDNIVINEIVKWLVPNNIDFIIQRMSQSFRNEFIRNHGNGKPLDLVDYLMGYNVRLIAPHDNLDDVWYGHLGVPLSKTWLTTNKDLKDAYQDIYSEIIYIDERPEDWKVPTFEKYSDEFYSYFGEQNVYGTSERKVFKLKVVPNFESATYNSGNMFGF